MKIENEPSNLLIKSLYRINSRDRDMAKGVSVVKTIVRNHFSEIINHGRVDKIEDIWADNCVIKGLQGRSFKGVRGVKKQY